MKIKTIRIISSIASAAVFLLLGTVLAMEARPFSSGGQILQSMSGGVETAKESGDRVGNYLLVGKDLNNLTDTIIIVSCFFDRGEAKLLSVPRDTYVDSEQVPYEKINSIYARAQYPYEKKPDIRNLAYCIKKMTGITLDGYIMTDFDSIKKTVDALGGVPITLEKSLYDPIEKKTVLSKGEHILNGEEAELFVRFRSGYLYGDLGRAEAQKHFLSAFLKKIKTKSLSELFGLVSELSGDIKSDLTVSRMLELTEFFKELPLENISAFTLPGVQFNTESGRACYAVNKDRLLELLNAHFFPQDSPLGEESINITVFEGLDYAETYDIHGMSFAN